MTGITKKFVVPFLFEMTKADTRTWEQKQADEQAEITRRQASGTMRTMQSAQPQPIINRFRRTNTQGIASVEESVVQPVAIPVLLPAAHSRKAGASEAPPQEADPDEEDDEKEEVETGSKTQVGVQLCCT